MTARSLFSLFAAALAASVFAACESMPDAPAPGPVVERPPVIRPVEPAPAPTPPPEAPPEVVEVPPTAPAIRPGLAPAQLAGRDVRRLGLLLPLSSPNPRLRMEAASMLRAAELAVFEGDADTVLLPLDSGGTREGAAQAARAAVERGADVILGPVLADEVRGAKAAVGATAGGNVPVVAFSTDSAVAGGGAYLLSFPPEAEVRRIVEHAVESGIQNFAVIHPANTYGRRVAAALGAEARRLGATVSVSESYAGSDVASLQPAVERLARQYRPASGGARASFEALLLPEGGTALRSLAPLLVFTDRRLAGVQLLGTSLWEQGGVSREPALQGGRYASADPEARRGFASSYERAYGSEPSGLASLAHDAVLFGAAVADGEARERRARVENREGFYGADGFVRFRADGQPVRGLAVFELRGGEARVLEPAPRTAAGVN